AGEVVIRRGAQVKATDGKVGKVDEFLINPVNGRITHLVMREGHLWGAKDVTIPVSEIEQIDDEVVHLKLDKQAISSLPTIPVKRKWK
ncbi:MAG TPA: PRC-barrel domain-containing protein, partial [Anaerolineales bacterium]|nr:PRC-barrel domain-containing protein [Anaerolineales bacterium]